MIEGKSKYRDDIFSTRPVLRLGRCDSLQTREPSVSNGWAQVPKCDEFRVNLHEFRVGTPEIPTADGQQGG